MVTVKYYYHGLSHFVSQILFILRTDEMMTWCLYIGYINDKVHFDLLCHIGHIVIEGLIHFAQDSDSIMEELLNLKKKLLNYPIVFFAKSLLLVSKFYYYEKILGCIKNTVILKMHLFCKRLNSWDFLNMCFSNC